MSKRESDVGRIGGAWIAAAIGLSEYSSPLDAYLRITGEVEDVVEGEAVDRGVFLEPALRQWHQHKINASEMLTPGTKRVPTVQWASYTPDAIAKIGGDSLLAEYKAPGINTAMKYGEAGTGQVPRDVGCQVHWGLFVTDLPKADVAALIDGELKIFHLDRDIELEREMFDRAQFFMREYVGAKKPPPATFSDRDTEWVKKRWPNSDSSKCLQWSLLSSEQRSLVDSYISLYLQEKSLTDALQTIENAVKMDVMKDYTTLIGDESSQFKRLDWKSNSTGGTNWKQVAERLLSNLSPEEQLEIMKSSSRSPSRVFRPYLKKGSQ